MCCPKSQFCLLGELKFKFRPCNSLSSLHHTHTGRNVGGQSPVLWVTHLPTVMSPKLFSKPLVAPNKSLLDQFLPASPCPWRLEDTCPHLLIGPGQVGASARSEGGGKWGYIRLPGTSTEGHWSTQDSSLCPHSILPLDYS